MLSNISIFSRSGLKIERAKIALNQELKALKRFKYKSIMDELEKLINELTASDEAQLEAYEQDITQAEADLDFHQKKITYFNALIKQRKEFIKQIEGKLKRVNTLEGKLIQKLKQ